MRTSREKIQGGSGSRSATGRGRWRHCRAGNRARQHAERTAGGDLQEVVGKMHDRRVVLRPRNMSFRSRRPVAAGTRRGVSRRRILRSRKWVSRHVPHCAPREVDGRRCSCRTMNLMRLSIKTILRCLRSIDSDGEEREFYVQEGVYFDPGVAHPLDKEFSASPPA